jgi:adenylate cyclase
MLFPPSRWLPWAPAEAGPAEGQKTPAPPGVGESAPALLDDRAQALVEPGIFPVKTIGDAAMLVSPEPAPLVESVLDLVAAAEGAGEGFPQLHAGAAFGPALNRSGDWYGRPVNLASRVSDVAEPGTVVVTGEVCEAAGEICSWVSVGKRELKGVQGEVEICRAERQAGP